MFLFPMRNAIPIAASTIAIDPATIPAISPPFNDVDDDCVSCSSVVSRVVVVVDVVVVHSLEVKAISWPCNSKNPVVPQPPNSVASC